ncbi:SCO6745 family protein [Dactylosporangium maewongense]
MTELSTERRMWSLFEPVHAVTYFAPDALAAFEEAALRGFWRGYFAGRSAPLGAVPAGPVIAAFYGFAPRMVTRALPDVWTRITPEAALAARLEGSRRVLLTVDGDLTEVASLLRAAAEAADLHGRVLGAANAMLPWPEDPAGVLWQAATVLREHRGDGHLAALLVEGLDGAECNVWRVALLDGAGREFYQPARGWTDEEWATAIDRLRGRGWLDAEGKATGRAREAYTSVERTTDALAATPWRALGETATARCAELLRPIAVQASALLRHPNPIGLQPLS